MARVIKFEGKTFSLPDDATDAEVQQVISSSPAAPAAAPLAAVPPAAQPEGPPPDPGESWTPPPLPPAAQPPERSALTEGLAAASQFPAGVRTGLANILGLPVDLVNGGLSFIGASTDKPFLGHKSIDEILRAPATAVQAAQDATGVHVFSPPEAPSGPVGRILHRVGEEVGAAAVPVGAGLRAGKAGVEAARELPALARIFAEPAAINPSKFVAKETTAALAAGTGAAGANEVTRGAGYKPGSGVHNAADMGGAFAGAGMAGLLKAIGRPLMNVIGAATGNPKFADSVIRDNVVDELARAGGIPNTKGADTRPLVDSIMNGPKASKVIPGFKETLADRTGNSGIASLEYNRSGGTSSGVFKQRAADNTTAVDTAMSKSAPTEQPGAYSSAAEAERTKQLADAGAQRQAAASSLDAHVQRMQPGMTGEGRGANIRAALEGASDKAKAVVDEAWAPINDSAVKSDITPLADRFNATTDALPVAERRRFAPAEAHIPEALAGRGEPPAPEPTGILGPDGAPLTRAPEPVDPNVPLKEVTGIRSALTDAAREAGTRGAHNEARVINKYIDALDAHMETAMPPELSAEYGAAKAATKDMHDRFSRPQTAIAQTLDRQQGQYRQPDSAVADKFVQSDEGNIADFKALMRETGGDARVVPALRDQMLSDVRSRGLLDKPAELDAYIARYNTVLSDPRFAAVRDELGTAAGLRRTLDSATSAEADLTKKLGTPEKAGMGVVGKYLSFSDGNAEQAMQGVLRAKKPGEAVDELLRHVGDDPTAVDGARKAFWNLMQKSSRSAGETTQSMSGVQPWLAGKLNKFLTDNAEVAARLYRDNPEHLANIKKIAETLQGTNTGARGKAAGTSGTAQIAQSVLPSMETLGSRAFALERGVVGVPFTVLNLAGIMARRATKGAQAAAFNAALDRALLDPDWAATLLKENNPANRAVFAKSAKAYWGNEASTYTDLLIGSGEKKDKTKDAIMRKGK